MIAPRSFQKVVLILVSIHILGVVLVEGRIGEPGEDASSGNYLDVDEMDEEAVEVMIGYKTEEGRAAIVGHAKNVHKEFKNVKVSAAVVPKSKLKDLESDTENIAFVEEDTWLYPDSSGVTTSDALPYGITMVQADILTPRRIISGISACDDEASFKVGVIDSGYNDLHPDGPCKNLLPPGENGERRWENCIGKDFDLVSGRCTSK